MDPLRHELAQALARLTVRPWRLLLDTPGVFATTPLLRGVWGNALHDLDLELYGTLFNGGPDHNPGYLIRPAPAGAPGPAVDFLLFGPPDRRVESAVWEAWEAALARGLGPERRPARLIEVRPLAFDGTPLRPARVQPGFPLAPLPWPGAEDAPCRLSFPAPLRLLRDKKLITHPTPADLALAAVRRLSALAPEASAAVWGHRHEWLERAQAVAAGGFRGEPCDLVRYSASQKADLELRGVAGELILPSGPGDLAELLVAATWLHLGKGTVMGLGEVRVVPLGG